MRGFVRLLCRYPVKGMNAEPLSTVELKAGEGLPGDRRFAIAHGASRFDPNAPAWQPPESLVTLLRCERLAGVRVMHDNASGSFTILRDGKELLSTNANSSIGRTVIGQFLTAYLDTDAPGSAHLVEAPNVMFTDVPEKWISVINMESMKDLERVVRKPLDPFRFRANLYFDGISAWQEFDWVGQEIAVGPACLRITERIERCAATNVDPETAQRNMNIPRSLQQGFGHCDMGVYAEVISGGTLRTGDSLDPPA